MGAVGLMRTRPEKASTLGKPVLKRTRAMEWHRIMARMETTMAR